MLIRTLFLFTLFISLDVRSMEIELKYSHLIDQDCEKKISLKSLEVLNTELPKLQKIWDLEAPMFYKALYQITGKRFLKKKINGSVFICFQPSFSMPLKLWIAPYLSSYKGIVRPHKYFVDLVFHEILHIFAVENLKGKNTALLRKYSKESQETKGHLHIMALQRAIYRRLGLHERLQELMTKDISFGENYARAWEIINDVEDFQPFVNELIGDPHSKFYKASLIEKILRN